MAEESPKPNEPTVMQTQDGRLLLIYRGGLADRGMLLLDEYAASLEGWRGLFQLLSELYFHQFPELRRVRGSRLLKIEIVAERHGSWQAILIFTLGAIAGGIIGNRADAVAVWSFWKLIECVKKVISAYVRKKSATTDITVLTASLRELMEQEGYRFAEPIDLEQEEVIFLPAFAEDDDEVPIDPTGRIDRVQALAERVDQLLKAATSPLEHSCERMSVVQSDGSAVLEIGPAERAVISAPLTLPPPKREWVRRRIKFERINRKTGRALFHFDGENEELGAHYSKIIDRTVHDAGNCYTQAFNDDASIDVWIRQTHPEPGRLNFQWEISSHNPDDMPLFNVR